MAKQFFKNFPEIKVTLDSGKVVRIKDFFRKSKIEQEAVNAIVEYTKYEIVDGERPDILATKLYGSGDLHWTFFLVNDFENYYDWHKDNATFEKYINTKYNGLVITANSSTDIVSRNAATGVVTKFLLGEDVTSISGKGNIIHLMPEKKQIVVDGKGFTTTETLTGKISGASFTPKSVIDHKDAPNYYKKADGTRTNVPTTDYVAVSNYDYEYDLNEEKRTIKIIKPSLINGIVKKFEQVMSS